MYQRFISPWNSGWKNVNLGIFQAVYICRDEKLIQDYLLVNLIDELNWFKHHLPSPDDRHFLNKYRDYTGICWFRSDAKAMIRRARRMVNIMRAAEVWITESRSSNPGQIVYRDDYQIIAHPHKRTPTKWG